MEYFNTYKNSLFTLLTRIMNQSVEGREFSEDEIEAMLIDNGLADEEFIKSVLGYNNSYGIMDFDFRPMINSDKKIPINPNKIEKRWLKSIIHNDFTKLFVDEKLVCKLESKLKDEEPLFEIDLSTENIDVELIKKIIFSFRNDKFIKYSFTYNNKEYEKIGIPFKLNYDLSKNKFRLSVYCIKTENFFYNDIDDIKSIEILEEIDDDLLKLKDSINNVGKNEFFKKQMKNKMDVLKLEIIPKFGMNTVERAHLLFSSYDKRSFNIDDKYILEVNYYKFDEQNVIKKILNLGIYATVIEPENIKQRIIELILKGDRLQTMVNS